MAVASICVSGDLVSIGEQTTAALLGDDYGEVIFQFKKNAPLPMF
jgi:hypothetical protein